MCVCEKKKKKKKKTTTNNNNNNPTHAHTPHTPRVSANKTAMSEWKHGKEGLMDNMDTEASAVFSK